MLSLRKANSTDVDIVFNWSNDALTRSNSFNQEEIKYENHVKWFNQKIIDNNSCFLIFEENNVPAGNVRIDIKADQNIIGIAIAHGFRGKKLATPMLELACNYFFGNFNEHIITAYIKENNLASYKSFVNAGFKEVDLTEYFGANSYKLIKKK